MRDFPKAHHREETQAVFQPQYDSLPMDGSPLEFFRLPVGAGASKGFSATNLYFPDGRLPTPQQFLVQSIHLDVTGSDAFRQRVAGQGYLQFIVGCKEYLMLGPLGVFMPTRKKFGKRIVPRRFKLDEAFEVSPVFVNYDHGMRVNVYMDFLPRRVERMYVHLLGHIYRPVQ